MLKRVKIAVLVSGGGTNLQALINAEKDGIITDGEIALVLSNNANAYALERARTAGIDTEVILRRECADARDFEDRMIAVLESHGIELIVLAGFMTILSEHFISYYRDRIINVHPSLIPSFSGKGFYGLRPHEAALEYGVKVTGATVHFVNEIPDGGRIIMQRAVDILDGDTPEILQRRVMEQAEWKILPLACQKICKELLSK